MPDPCWKTQCIVDCTRPEAIQVHSSCCSAWSPKPAATSGASSCRTGLTATSKNTVPRKMQLAMKQNSTTDARCLDRIRNSSSVLENREFIGGWSRNRQRQDLPTVGGALQISLDGSGHEQERAAAQSDMGHGEGGSEIPMPQVEQRERLEIIRVDLN